ncbi:unnamed protein product [Bursaphelenchus okinawaensis]|uniref:Uncharacterized protein n=1 Tax=Bursaphelenchus okinawaensis TaxID=465554 RepID=A0A811JRZ2_9BILA|nr:unnamed protein product [Bursaphelenchus okinawaensis]CAG9080394.1 unnamed protein product [Bursaphelenchus okinawaensis]
MNTPQRQQQRRPRRHNENGPTTSTAKPLHTVQSTGCMEMRTPRPRRQRSSVSLCSTPKTTGASYGNASFSASRATFNSSALGSSASSSGSASSVYAGSKFTDSPMARHVPQPPCTWLTDFQRSASALESKLKWRASPTPSTSSSGMASISETDSVDELVVLPPSRNQPTPIKVHPLQLISACAAV